MNNEKTFKVKDLTATEFVNELMNHASEEQAKKSRRYFKTGKGDYGEGDVFIGVKMGQIFELVKAYSEMPIEEIEKLLENEIHEIRAGGVSIMDKASRKKKLSPDRLKDFYELYMRRIDRINNWDLVDLGCMHLTGCYLFDKKRDILYNLAKSSNLWERRIAIVSTCYFIRQGDLDDTFALAEMLVEDKIDLIHKGTGWMLRMAGDRDRQKLISFLDKFASTMPRTMLRYSIEKFDKEERTYYLKLK